MQKVIKAIAALATITLLVSACGSSTDSQEESTQPTETTETETTESDSTASDEVSGVISAELPENIQESGVLRVGTNVPYVPMQMLAEDGETFIGLEIDMITEAASRLGLDVTFENADWDGLIPALNAGRHDTLASSFGDFVERQETVDLVDFLRGGLSALVRAEDAGQITEEFDLCGKKIGVENGTASVTLAESISSRCVEEGLDPITSNVFPTSADASVALLSGRVDAVIDDLVIVQSLGAEQPDRYAVVLPDLGTPFYYGFVLRKTDQGLSQGLVDALNSMIADGTYAAIAAEYGIGGDSLLTEAMINGGTTSLSD